MESPSMFMVPSREDRRCLAVICVLFFVHEIVFDEFISCIGDVLGPARTASMIEGREGSIRK